MIVSAAFAAAAWLTASLVQFVGDVGHVVHPLPEWRSFATPSERTIMTGMASARWRTDVNSAWPSNTPSPIFVVPPEANPSMEVFTLAKFVVNCLFRVAVSE